MEKGPHKRFREYLEQNLYDVLYAEISNHANYNINPWQTENIILSNLNKFELRIRVMFRFLLLGYKYTQNEIKTILGKEILDILSALDLLRYSDDKVYLQMSVISYHGLYLVVDIPYFYQNCIRKMPEIYIGADTYLLANYLPKARLKNVLDLCTGSGIQGIVLAGIAENVVCVEYNPTVVPYTHLNVTLNEVNDKIEIIESDLYTDIGDRKFDLIVSNPPFIPVPNSVKYPICGTGGEDGLVLIDKIVSGFEHYLQDNGIGIIIGECLGKKGDTLLMKHLMKILPMNYEITLLLHSRTTTDVQIGRVIELCKSFSEINEEEVRKIWEKIYDKLNVNEYYGFYLYVHKKQCGESKFKTIKAFNDIDVKQKIVCNRCEFELTNEIFNMKFNNQVTGKTDGIGRQIYELANNKTVQQLIDEMCIRYKGKREANEVVDLIIRLCDYFGQIGLMEFK